MKVLHLDTNHQLLIQEFSALGFENHEDYTSSKKEIQKKIKNYDGIVIRSRFPIDTEFLDAATNLKFIGRVGAGMENIDVNALKKSLKAVELNCIKQRIEERGLTQRWVAEKLNKTNNTVNCWCANRVQPHLSDLVLLSVLLKCKVKDLIADIDGHLLIHELRQGKFKA